ncbi:CBM_collapsed_G0020700.mRNA.1.CDS.1 [Saccharomyces cerevisiae]|nr:CBM_collapsed_G0020700.mRNA.1.CDS.1 [Saccharomyces cerevisiae]
MGGKVAMMLVLKNPQLCSMLVCIENAPVSLRPNAEFVEIHQSADGNRQRQGQNYPHAETG